MSHNPLTQTQTLYELGGIDYGTDSDTEHDTAADTTHCSAASGVSA